MTGTEMEQKKRHNAQSGNTVRGAKQNPENVAATKIQAGFRGYKVRKEMKDKNALDITNPKQRGNRRRASGKIVDSNRNTVPVVTTTTADGAISDLEEKSATKIQAGVRGFLVRRRNQKNNNKN